MRKTIHYIDMFAGMGGFREGLTRAGDFVCMGHCEIDKYADRSYRALFDTEGEWFIDDVRKADPETMPDFELLCGGFPCQAFSLAGNRRGFGDPRGTLFFELARLAEARKPRYLLFENVPGLLSHDGGRTFATILHTLDRLGYGVEWQVLNSKDFGVPQSRRRVYIIGYLDGRCRGKILPVIETAGTSLVRFRPEKQQMSSKTICSIQEKTMGQPRAVNNPRVTKPEKNYKRIRKPGAPMFTLTTVDRHAVCYDSYIRRLTPRECLRLQGWKDERIDKVLSIQSDNQVYKQAGNGVTVNVVEAIGRRLTALDTELYGGEVPGP